MKHLLLIASLIIMSGTVRAQNWQTVRTNDTNFYSGGWIISYSPVPDSNLIRTMWVDSSRAIAGDSVFYFYRGIRADPPTYNTCIDTLAPSWLGPKMIRKPDGTELYFNSKGDTITFHTLAGIGASWTLAKDVSGKTYMGTVTTVAAGNVDGVADSVKTISIVAMSGSAPVSDPYNTLVFQLSKAHGWIKTLDLYRFPNKLARATLVGMIVDSLQHLRLPKSYSTWGIYHTDLSWRYAVGSETITTSSNGTQPFAGANSVVVDDSVVSNTLLAPDTMHVTFRTKKATTIWTSTAPFSSTTTIDTFTHTDTVYTGPGYQVKTLPLYESKLSPVSNSPLGYYPVSRYCAGTACGGRWIVGTKSVSIDHLEYNTSSGCWIVRAGVSGFIMNLERYIQDFGRVLSIVSVDDPGGPASDFYTRTEVTYASLPGCTWGTKINVLALGVGNTPSAASSFSIAPNPANDRLIINSGSTGQTTQAILRNLTGQTIWQGAFLGGSYSLPTSTITPGLYFLEIVEKEARQVFKVNVVH